MIIGTLVLPTAFDSAAQKIMLQLKMNAFNLRVDLSFEDEVRSGSGQRRRSADVGGVGDAESHSLANVIEPCIQPLVLVRKWREGSTYDKWEIRKLS